jgi:hypothetical protein
MDEDSRWIWRRIQDGVKWLKKERGRKEKGEREEVNVPSLMMPYPNPLYIFCEYWIS